jgi:hypothetical protein
MKYILSAIVLFLAVESGAADVETPTMGWSSWNAFRVNISEGTKSRSSATPCCPTSTVLSFPPFSK